MTHCVSGRVFRQSGLRGSQAGARRPLPQILAGPLRQGAPKQGRGLAGRGPDRERANARSSQFCRQLRAAREPGRSLRVTRQVAPRIRYPKPSSKVQSPFCGGPCLGGPCLGAFWGLGFRVEGLGFRV